MEVILFSGTIKGRSMPHRPDMHASKAIHENIHCS